MGTPPGSDQRHPAQPAPALPPGVYFSPTPQESLEYLNCWIDGETIPDADGTIFHDDVYGASPDVLRRRHPPGNSRGGDHMWWFLGVSRFQCPGGGRRRGTTRADRQVATGGSWRLEQSRRELPGAVGARNSFGFYLSSGRSSRKKDKTPWLMEEYTSARDDGTGKSGVPALYRVYVTPRATDDQLRDIYGEDGVTVRPDGTKKPARVVVPTEYFDAVAALLPPTSIRGLGQEQSAPPLQGQFLETATPTVVLGHQGQFFETAPPLPPPPPPAAVLDDDFRWKFMETTTPLPLPPPPPSAVLDDDFQWQFTETATPLPPPPPPSVLDENFQGQFMETATHLPPPPPPGVIDDDFQGHIMATATPLPPPPPPAVADDFQWQYFMEAATLPPPGVLGQYEGEVAPPEDFSMWDLEDICPTSDFLIEA